MSELAPSARTGQHVFSALRYVDAPAAIAWLERAFGAERHLVVPGADGKIAHAQLLVGGDIVMLGSSRNDDLHFRSPRELGAGTMSLYVLVDASQLEAYFARSRDAGAEIVRALADTDYGSREFAVRDPEGHLWSFGTYAPHAL